MLVEQGPALGRPAANVRRRRGKRGVPTLVRFFAETLSTGRGRHQPDLLLGNAPSPTCLHQRLRGGHEILLRATASSRWVSAPVGSSKAATTRLPRALRICHDDGRAYFPGARPRAFRRRGTAHARGSLRIYARHDEGQKLPVTASVVGCVEAGPASRLDYYTSFGEWCVIEATPARVPSRGQGSETADRRLRRARQNNTLLNYCGIGADFLDYAVDRSPYRTDGSRGHAFRLPARVSSDPSRLRADPALEPQRMRSSRSFIREWGGRSVCRFRRFRSFLKPRAATSRQGVPSTAYFRRQVDS